MIGTLFLALALPVSRAFSHFLLFALFPPAPLMVLGLHRLRIAFLSVRMFMTQVGTQRKRRETLRILSLVSERINHVKLRVKLRMGLLSYGTIEACWVTMSAGRNLSIHLMQLAKQIVVLAYLQAKSSWRLVLMSTAYMSLDIIWRHMM